MLNKSLHVKLQCSQFPKVTLHFEYNHSTANIYGYIQ